MYNVNRNEKYYISTVLGYDSKNIYIEKTVEFNSFDELLTYIAKTIYFDQHHLPHSIFFDQINMTGKDYFISSNIKPVRNEDGSFKLDCNGNVVHKEDIHKVLYKYIFYDAESRQIDIRDYIPQILKIYQSLQSLSLSKKLKNIKFNYIHRTYPTSHTCCYHRYTGHMFSRLKGYYSEKCTLEDDGIDFIYNPKPREIRGKRGTLKSLWWDDRWARGESNWKTKKYKKQWMHNLYNGNKKNNFKH